MQEHTLIIFLSAAYFFLKEVEDTVSKKLLNVHLDITLPSTLTTASILRLIQMTHPWRGRGRNNRQARTTTKSL